jgi:putative heme-binding domain-containing protein
MLAERVKDEHPRVRMEAVRALGGSRSPRAAALALHALDLPTDKFLDYALWLTLRELEPQWLQALQKGELSFGGNVRYLTFALETAGAKASVRPLVDLVRAGKVPRDREESALAVIAALGSPQDLTLVLDLVLKEGTAYRKTALLLGLARAARQRKVRPAGDLNRIAGLLDSDNDALRSATVRLAGLWQLENLRPRLNEMATAKQTSVTVRQAVFESLVALGGKASQEMLEEVAGGKQPFEVRRVAAAALAELDVTAAARKAVEVLASGPADADPSDLVAAFLQQKKGAEALTAALAGRKLPADVAKVALRSARASGREVATLVDALSKAGGLTAPLRTLTPTQMEQLIADVARRGDAARGEAVYRRKDQACMKCHAVAGAGGQVGPDLVSIGASAQVDYLIDSLLLPNKQVKEGYHSVVVTTTRGQILTGIKVRETKSELILRTAEDRVVRIPVKQIDDQKVGLSLMPEGLTDPLTRAELVDLVRFLSELGRTSAYQAGKERVVRRWQVLEPTPEAERVLRQEGPAATSRDAPWQTWSPVYSRVAGVMPLSDVSAFKGPRVCILRCQFEVTTPGKAKMALNSATGLRLWVDGDPITADKEVVLDLKTGLHTLTLAVDREKRREQEALRVEVVDVSGSPAQVRLIGGK